MIDPRRCRLLRHGPALGAWNMAVDEVLLEQVSHQAGSALVVPPSGGNIPPTMSTWCPGGTTSACLRIYGWSEPTLSLGYFQTYSDRNEHRPSLACPAVRRLTGGGAILHDDEMTYSIVLPGTHPLAARRDELYQAVHGCLIEALGQFDVTARLFCCGEARKAETAREPFLCFQRRSPGDVLIGGNKICGSAQRRRNKAVLQHGSLLWRTSFAAPELPGVIDLVTHPIESESLIELWLSSMSRRLGFAWQSDSLDENETREAESLAQSRYACDDWTINRGRSWQRSQETL